MWSIFLNFLLFPYGYELKKNLSTWLLQPVNARSRWVGSGHTAASTPFWHRDCFKMKAIENQQMQEECGALPLLESKAWIYFSPFFQLLATINLHSVSVDLIIFDIWCVYIYIYIYATDGFVLIACTSTL